ncbi:carboxypeptidase-like regulatory domain-containing protein [Bacteroides sp. 224]|uniref:carboxypeptidase-like regulatory domain-containing protein n=1 Tax=Bacteroides sp. 224 TaxID=2302936 RepID=UPI001EF182F2|nr:carboxypeptidase-like regulatory domain-containing protein [Bacteroides sp. 224]
MKSKLFGFNAKLALALLAISGTMFTSCYESDKEDVYIPKPTELPEPVYTIAGTVTDLITGKGIAEATVTFTATGSTVTTKTDAAGGFSVHENVMATTYSVVVTPKNTNEYDASVARSLVVTQLSKGQSAAYMFNEVLNPKDFKPEGVRTVSSSENAGTTPKKYEADEHKESLDIVNTTNKDWQYYVDIEVNTGGVVIEGGDLVNLTRAAASAELKAYITNFLKGRYIPLKVDKDENFVKGYHTFQFSLPANTFLKSLTVITKYYTDTHKFIYGDDTFTVKVKYPYAYELAPERENVQQYHGHGHGNDDNAGGGIIAPIN